MNRGFSGPPTTPPPAEPIDTHEHEWRPQNGDNPVIEDGAVIFFEECDWVEVTGSTHSEKHDETFHSYGADCEATRSWRMEATSFTKKRESEPDVEYLIGEGHDEEPALIAAESQGEITMCDPEKIGGSVRVETEEWAVLYEAGY
jgi:hypothetical protein